MTGCTHNCRQGRDCVCARFHDPDFNADDFGAQEGWLRELVKTVLGGLAYVAAAVLIALALAAAFPKGPPL